MRAEASKFTIALVVAAVSGLSLATYAIGVSGHDGGPAAPDGPLLGWQPQGSLRGDTELADRAGRAWKSGSPTGRPYGDPKVLFAGGSAEGGYGPSGGQVSDGVVVVLQSRSRGGGATLAYLTDIDWWSGLVRPAGPLRLVAEQPLSDPTGVRAIGSLVGGPGSGGSLVIGLAEPGAWVEGFTSTDWHSYSDSEEQSGFKIEVVPHSAVPERTMLSAKRGDDVIHDEALAPNSLSEDR